MARELIAAVDSAGQDSHHSANVVATEVIKPGTIIKPITEDEMKMELIAATDSAEQDSHDPATVAWLEGITPGTIITPITADEMEMELIGATDSAEQWSHDPATVEATEVIAPAAVITPIMADGMETELIAVAGSAGQWSSDPANVEATEIITPAAVITPIMADEMETELIAAAGSAGQWSPDPANVVTTEVITLATVITPISQEVVAPESDSSEAMLVDNAPMFGEAFAKTESSGRRVLLILGALLLLAGGGAGLWWYAQKGANEKVAPASGSAAPASSGVIPAGNKLWELIPDQTSGVADAANVLEVADQRMAVINPGGQLALEYRGGKFFGDGHGADMLVYGLEQERVSYLIFVRNDPAEKWTRIDINGKGFPRGEAGHDMGHHGVRQARQVMIRNDGNADLRIDAVSVKYKDEVQGKGVTRHRH